MVKSWHGQNHPLMIDQIWIKNTDDSVNEEVEEKNYWYTDVQSILEGRTVHRETEAQASNPHPSRCEMLGSHWIPKAETSDIFWQFVSDSPVQGHTEHLKDSGEENRMQIFCASSQNLNLLAEMWPSMRKSWGLGRASLCFSALNLHRK